MKRLRSYTVIEMLVVMMISTMSIVITYTCYTIFSNHYLSYKKRSDELATHVVFDRLFAKDISTAKAVQKTAEGVACISKKERIQYEFYEDYILRRGTMPDTFKIRSSSQVSLKKQGKEEYIPGELVDEIIMGIIYKEEKLYFYYKKNYGADVLMSREELHSGQSDLTY
jgi:hypothetical protein